MSRHLSRWAEPLLLVTIAVGIFVDSLSYPSALVPGAPGPAFFPRLLTLVLVACAGWLAWRPPGVAGAPLDRSGSPGASRGESGSTRGPPGGSTAGSTRDTTGGSTRLVSAIALIAGFLLLASRLDSYVLLPLLVGGLMAIMGERRVPALTGVPILFTLFVYVVFVLVLGVPLPARLP